MNVPVLSKIKAWKEKRLRKKIVLRLLSNPNYKPSDCTMNLAESSHLLPDSLASESEHLLSDRRTVDLLARAALLSEDKAL